MTTKIYYDLPFEKIKDPDAIAIDWSNKLSISLLWTDIVLTVGIDGTHKWRRRHFDAREITEEEALQEVGL